MAAKRIPGSLGLDPFSVIIDDGTLVRAPSPIPGPIGLVEPIRQARAWAIVTDARSVQEALAGLAEEEREFALISEYGIADRHGKRLDKLEKYLDYRERCFGPRRSYLDFAADAERELTQDLRKCVDTVDRRPAGDGEAAQTLLYCWIRKAYKIKHGESFDVPAHVLKAKANWQHLKQLLEKVKAVYSKPFAHSTVLVLRPVKQDVGGVLRYLLGTYSEHGEGLAVDVEWEKNPTLSEPVWQFIHHFVGRQIQIDRSKQRWENDPKSLWADIKGLSDEFAQKVASDVTRWKLIFEKASGKQYDFALEAPTALTEEEQQILWKRYPGYRGVPKSISDSDALDLVFDKAGVNKRELEGLASGFFTLEEDLVLAFYNADFTWGATFSNQADLMHFQLDVDDGK